MAQGGFLSNIGNWAKNTFNAAYEWLNENVSGLPLGGFSALATILPNVPLWGTKYYIPSGIDPNVLALFSRSQWSRGAVSYSFTDSRSDYEAVNFSASGFKPVNFNTEQAVRYILEGFSPYSGGPKMSLTSVEGFTNLDFVDLGHNGADIKIGGFTPGQVINRSHAYYPGVPVYGGDTWLTQNSGVAAGSSTYALVLHELGHALGMKHTHDSSWNLPKMPSHLDSTEFTVMSYNETLTSPQTYMQYDIAALQKMYGADFTTNGGDTVYKWNPQTGETYVNGVGQGIPYSNKVFLTVWDGNGNDTYDMSNYNGDMSINLAPGKASRFSMAQLGQKKYGVYVDGNVYNAFQYEGDPRSLIENAKAGSGNDTVRGNVARNVLWGNEGNDTLLGFEGHDTLHGGAGDDIVYGGAGADYLTGGRVAIHSAISMHQRRSRSGWISIRSPRASPKAISSMGSRMPVAALIMTGSMATTETMLSMALEAVTSSLDMAAMTCSWAVTATTP
jgi:serralysin